MMNARACVIVAAVVSSSSCASYKQIDSRPRSIERIDHRDLVANGSERRAVIVAQSDRDMTIRVFDIEVCRSSVAGQVWTSNERSFERTNSATIPLVGGITSLVIGLAGLKLAGDRYEHDDPMTMFVDESTSLRPQYFIGTTFGILGLAFGVPTTIAGWSIAAAPERKTEVEQAHAMQPLSRWDGPAEPCKTAQPRAAINQRVGIALSFDDADTTVRFMAVTGADGTVVVPVTAAIASASTTCGTPIVRIATEPMSTGEDTPSAPSTTLRGTTLDVALPIAGGAKADDAFRDLTRACCAAKKRSTYTAICETECASAGKLEVCTGAFRACTAAVADDAAVDEGKKHCEQLFGECLEVRRTTTELFMSCIDACSRSQALASCH